MIEDLHKLKNYNVRLTTVLNELQSLEDGIDCDYSYVVICLQQATQHLERRRENLQRRGRTQ